MKVSLPPLGTRVVKKILDRWHDYRYEKHWSENADRRYMARVAFPALLAQLGKREQFRLLDIGVRWYTARNHRWFRAEHGQYWVNDIEPAPPDLSCDVFLRGDFAQLPDRYPFLSSSFDAVISYGVLGYFPFPSMQVEKYLLAAAKILKPDGVFLLKLDLSRMLEFPSEARVTQLHWNRYFRLAEDLEPNPLVQIDCAIHSYQFLTLIPLAPNLWPGAGEQPH